MNTHRALDQKSGIRALERKLSQLRLSQHGRQRRDSPPDRCPKPERYEQDQGQGRSRVRPIIRLLLVQRLGPQPQRTGATSKFVHQVPSIWCAPHSLTQFLCRNVSSSCVIKVSLPTSSKSTAARKLPSKPAPAKNPAPPQPCPAKALGNSLGVDWRGDLAVVCAVLMWPWGELAARSCRIQ